MENQEQNQAIEITSDELSKANSNVLNTQQLNFLLSETPQKHIYKRPAKGGGTWDFVTGVYVKKVLNLMFGWDWDFEVVDFQVIDAAKQCVVHGKLTCRVGEKTIVKHQFGRADIKYKTRKDENNKKIPTDQPLDLGNDLKAATTDALKKCASELGVASDIYGANEFKAISVVDEKNDWDEITKEIKAFTDEQKLQDWAMDHELVMDEMFSKLVSDQLKVLNN